MAALDFPDNPATGDLYGSSGTVWRWDGARWASTAGASGARGRVAYAQIVANQYPITTEVVIAGLTVTVTMDPSRTYRVTAYARINDSNPGERIFFKIVQDGTTQIALDDTAAAAGGFSPVSICQAVISGLSGSHTFAPTVARMTGTGSLTVVAAPTAPAFILVEDITYEAGSSGVGIEPTAWTAVTFQNGWSNFGSGFQDMQYRKQGDMVYLRGAIKGGTLAAVAFNLPVGFRPPASVSTTLVATTTAFGVSDINAAGDVTVHGAANGIQRFLCNFSVTP